METVKADIIIIGGGPGGYEVAGELTRNGQKVVIIEKDLLGGTCLNRGCIPTKALAASAEILLRLGEAGEFGIEAGSVSADYGRARQRARQIVETLRGDIAESLSRATVVHETARFLSNTEVAAGDCIYSADKIIIATGSCPAALRCPSAELAITSDDFLAMDSLPDGPAVIVGGGVIGLEFACILNAFGVDVTVVEYCKEILPGMDSDLAKRLRSSLTRRGIKILCGTAVEEICTGGYVRCSGRKGSIELPSAMTISAVGRRAVLPDGLENTDIKVNERGFIAVDTDTYVTTVPGIYAVGDVNGTCMLAHAAAAQARRAAGLLSDTRLIPAVVFTVPQLAAVGGSEGTIVKIPYSANGKALADGNTEGLLKLVCDADSGRITGCHALGAHAADLVAEATVAISAGMTADRLAGITHAHPSLSELLAEAARRAAVRE